MARPAMAVDLSRRSLKELVAEQRAAANWCLAVCQAFESRLETDGAEFVDARPPAKSSRLETDGAESVDVGPPAKSSVLTIDLAEPLLPPDYKSEERTPRRNREPEACAIFPDTDAVRKLLKGNISKETYNVANYYHTDGVFQALARSSTFNTITMCVIFLNVIWIGIDTDMNKADLIVNADPVFQVAENLFCSYFSFEIFTRLMAFKHKANAFADGWFVFDFTLVALMVWEVWITTAMTLLAGAASVGASGNTTVLRVFRLFRLARATRVARIFKFFPELATLLHAMLSATRAVAGTLALLIIILYVFAILLTQLLQGSDAAKDCFGSVPESMNCLMGQGVFSSQMDKLNELLALDWTYFMVFLSFLCITTLMVLNLLIGVLCEVVGSVAAAEKAFLTMSHLKARIPEVIHLIDVAGDHCVTREEFRSLIQHPHACRILTEVDVDVVALVDVADFIFEGKTQLSLDDFVETIMQFRGVNGATVKDIVDLRKCLVKEFQNLERDLRQCLEDEFWDLKQQLLNPTST